MLEQLKHIHAWFTGERELPDDDTNPAALAAACYLSAEPVKRWLFPDYDPICDEARKLLDKGIAAGDIDALRLSVYIDMGLWIQAEYDWELLPIHLKALYDATGDEEIKDILENYPQWFETTKKEREDAQFIILIQTLRDQGLPPDLGAHDPAYYENDT